MRNIEEKDNHVAYYNWTTMFDTGTLLFATKSRVCRFIIDFINQSRGPCKRSAYRLGTLNPFHIKRVNIYKIKTPFRDLIFGNK